MDKVNGRICLKVLREWTRRTQHFNYAFLERKLWILKRTFGATTQRRRGLQKVCMVMQ